MSKCRLRDRKSLAQDHTASKWQNLNWRAGSCLPHEALLFTPRLAPNSSLRWRQSQHLSPGGLLRPGRRAFVSGGSQPLDQNCQPLIVPGQVWRATAQEGGRPLSQDGAMAAASSHTLGSISKATANRGASRSGSEHRAVTVPSLLCLASTALHSCGFEIVPHKKSLKTPLSGGVGGGGRAFACFSSCQRHIQNPYELRHPLCCHLGVTRPLQAYLSHCRRKKSGGGGGVGRGTSHPLPSPVALVLLVGFICCSLSLQLDLIQEIRSFV